MKFTIKLLILYQLVLNLALADTVTTPIRSMEGHKNRVTSVVISPDGRYALTLDGFSMKLWKVSNGTNIRSFGEQRISIGSIAISQDGRYVISGSRDKTMKLWDISNGTVIRSFKGFTNYVEAVALSPDGLSVLSGSDDNILKLWSISNGTEIRSFEGHTSFFGIDVVTFSPDGSYVLSCASDMKLWNVFTGTEIRTFEGAIGCSSAVFSPDGNYILSNQRNNMKMWDVSNEAEIRSFEGHTNWVSSVTLSRDGSYALSGSHDNTMKLWDVSSGAEIRSFEGHTDNVNSVAFSPNGRYVYSGSGDRTLKMWDSGINTTLPPQVSNQPPKATFTISPNQGNAPLTVQLDASASSDDGNIVKYQWAASDGQTAEGVKTSLTFSQTGNYDITLTITDNNGATATNKQTVTITAPPPPPSSDSFGQAIIIAAGGAKPSNTLYKYTNEYTQRFYRLIKERGFKDGDIAYMNPQAPDIDLDGHLENDLLDYELFDPKSELKTAFQQAANKLTAGQQFIFFLHGHARKNSFRIMEDYELSATDLRDLLAMLPANVQQILILDSCYSGSFFDELMGNDRILISSADNKNQAWNTKNASFTDTFLRSLRRGMTLRESFEQAKDMIIKDKQLFGEQDPWLDDDGNGLYNSGDGRRAAKIQLGKEGFHAAPPPTIHQIHPLIVLEENITEANLWVRTTPGVDGIHKVRAVLINPEFSSGEYKGVETNFGREELELIYNAVQQRYGILYQGFKTPGMWRILYQAQSKDGVWSDIVQGEVQAQGSNKAATIKMQLNQSGYKITEPLRLEAVINGQTKADLYVAIILPNGQFITFKHPSIPSWPNEAQTYKANLKIEGKKTHSINLNLPNNSTLGKYQTCGVLVQTATKPLELEHWIDFNCVEFEVY